MTPPRQRQWPRADDIEPDVERALASANSIDPKCTCDGCNVRRVLLQFAERVKGQIALFEWLDRCEAKHVEIDVDRCVQVRLVQTDGRVKAAHGFTLTKAVADALEHRPEPRTPTWQEQELAKLEDMAAQVTHTDQACGLVRAINTRTGRGFWKERP